MDNQVKMRNNRSFESRSFFSTIFIHEIVPLLLVDHLMLMTCFLNLNFY